MKTVYLDNNIYRYYLNGFPKNMDTTQEKEALEKLKQNPEIDFVVSVWNLYEALNTKTKEEVTRYGKFMESLSPKYTLLKPNIQEQEIKNYVYKCIFAVATIRPHNRPPGHSG